MSHKERQLEYSLEEMGEFLSKFSEHSDHVYWISAPDFSSIQFVSPSYERVWGRRRESLYHDPESWITFLHPEDAISHNPLLCMAEEIHRFGEKARYNSRYRIIRPDGEIRWIHDRGFPLMNREGVCYGVTGIAIDVTEEHQAAEALQIARDKAEEANRAKDLFLQNMSHDIRTPLAGIIGMSSLLEQEAHNLVEKNYAHDVLVSGEKLLGLLNSVLELVRDGGAEHRKRPESVSIRKMYQDLKDLEMPSAKLKGIAIHMDVDPLVPNRILVDDIKLHRILLNLIGNALKFTEKGHITLHARVLKTTRSRCTLELSIEDTGPGIPAESMEKIFERFYQIPAAPDATREGNGIGLHIVRQYIRSLGGKVHVRSTPGSGSTFTVTLPVRIDRRSMLTPEPAESPNITAVSPFSACSVLLVEDNRIARKTAEILLQKAGCQSVSASSGEVALEQFKSHHFDLVLTDVGLPGITGTVLAGMIRQYEKDHDLPPVPIVGLTAHTVGTTGDEAMQAGMSLLLVKPISESMLSEILYELVPHTKDTPKVQPPLPDDTETRRTLDAWPLLDTEKGVHILGSDTVLEELLTLMHHEEIDKDIHALEVAEQSRDPEKIRALSHRIKAGASCCGTIRLQKACQSLEESCSKPLQATEAVSCQPVIEVLHATKKHIASWLEARAAS